MSINRILIPIVLVLALLLTLRQAGVFDVKEVSIPAPQLPKIETQQAAPKTDKLPEVPQASRVVPAKISLPYRIAFLSSQDHEVKQGYSGAEYTYELYMIDMDGKQSRLTSGNGYSSKAAPIWSPDATNIALANTIISAVGKNKWNTRAVVGSWSPDSQLIAYSVDQDIYVSAVDGRSERQLTNNIYNAQQNSWYNQIDQLNWSPDGTKILFYKYSGLYTVDSSGGSQIRLTDDGKSAKWSPDGWKIAFTKRYPFSLFVINKSLNTEPLEIYYGFDGIGEPAWSPDSQKIVFSARPANPTNPHRSFFDSTNNNPWNLYIVNSDGSNRLQLTGNKTSDLKLGGFSVAKPLDYLSLVSHSINPDWSPDGRFIVYESNVTYYTPDLSNENKPVLQTTGSSICIMNADGSNQRALTTGTADNCLPKWAPK